MRNRPSLEAADAQAVLDAACAHAAANSVAASVAVVDDAGILLALRRLDGARLHTPDVATRKARTAAIIRTDTATLAAQVRDDLTLLAFSDRLSVGGGLPLVWQGVVVGAIGTSGGTPAQDEAISAAGQAALPG